MNLQVVSSQTCECTFSCPVNSDVNEIAACPSSPVADHPSALPSPTSSPSST